MMTHVFKTKILTTSALIAVGITSHSAIADETKTLAAPEIIISASPLARTTMDLASPITTLNRDDIRRDGAGTLGGLLGNQPGVTQSSFARGASRPIIRGLDNTRVRIQENGLAAHDVSALSEDHGVPIDPYSAESIEVIRGPAVLRYGSEAIGGLVSVLNDRIPDRAPTDGLEGEAQTEYTSVDKGWQGAGSANFSVGSFVGHIDGFAREAGDYEIPTGGVQANSGARSSGFSLGGSYLFLNGHVGASITNFDSDYRVPGAEASANQLYIDLEQSKFRAEAKFEDFSGFITAINANIGYSDYTHDEVSRLTGTIGSRFNNEEWESRVELLHAPIGNFEGAFGLQLSQRDLQASGEGGELIAPSERDVIAGFLFEEIQLNDAITLQFGGRVEQVSIKGLGVNAPTLQGVTLPGAELADFGTNRNLTFTPVSGSAAAIFDIGYDLSLGISAQYVERAPDLLELFAKGPHEATETFEVGDPSLKIESARSLEVSLKRETGPITFEAAGFYTSFENFINKTDTGFVCGEEFDTCGIAGALGVEDELRQVSYSQADADFHGLELGAKWDAISLNEGTVGIDGRFDYVVAEFTNGGNVPRIPPMRYGLGLFYETDTLFSRLSFLQAERQSNLATGETTTGGYTDLRFEATYAMQLPDTDRQIELGIVGTNLLDEQIRNHVSFKKDDVLEPGASARFFVRARF